MPRQEYAEICLISTTGEPNQRIAAGCTEPAIQRSSSDTIGHACRRRDACGAQWSGRRRFARGVAQRGRPIDQRPPLVEFGREVIAGRRHWRRRAIFWRRSGRRHAVGSAKVVGLRGDTGLIRHTRRIERHRLIGSDVTPRLRRAHLIVRQHARWIGRLRRSDRPTRRHRTARNVGGWPQIVAVAERPALAQGRHLERKVGPAHPGTTDRPDADDARAFLDGTRVEALHLGLMAPRRALGKKTAAAAPR